MPVEGTLSKDELCHKSVFNIITSAESSLLLAEHLHLNTHLHLTSRVKSYLSYDEPNIEAKAANLDKRFVLPIITDLARHIMPLTAGIWLKETKKDEEHAINADIQASSALLPLHKLLLTSDPPSMPFMPMTPTRTS